MHLFELAEELNAKESQIKTFLKDKGYILKNKMDTVPLMAANLARQELPAQIASEKALKEVKLKEKREKEKKRRATQKKKKPAAIKKKVAVKPEVKVEEPVAPPRSTHTGVVVKTAATAKAEKQESAAVESAARVERAAAEQAVVTEPKAEVKDLKPVNPVDAKSQEALEIMARAERIRKETEARKLAEKESARIAHEKARETAEIMERANKIRKEKEAQKALENARLAKEGKLPGSFKPEPVVVEAPVTKKTKKKKKNTGAELVPNTSNKNVPGAYEIMSSINQAQSSTLTKRKRPAASTDTGFKGKKKGVKTQFGGVANREEQMNRPRLSSSASLRQKVADRSAKPGAATSGRVHRKKRHQAAKPSGKKIVVQKKVAQISIPISLREFSQETGVKVGDIIKIMMKLGNMITINDFLDNDSVELIAAELDLDIIIKDDDKLEEFAFAPEENEKINVEDGVSRPPVVVFMGHVDHGKTSLLDAIRKTHVANKESGGITQHIGSYEVAINDSSITFIDTPGHEAFTTMRARGAHVTDIAVLVVAADDGLMPQTLEAISHARAANVPIIVAINKMDLPSANVDQVLRQLTEQELMPEDWGGQTICCRVSAMTGEGMDQLLEMINLQAEILELKALDSGPAEGIVLEAQMDPGRGATVNVIVQSGVLKKGDPIVCGNCFGRARSLYNDKGQNVESAGASKPVQILGFSEVPEPGSKFRVATSERHGRELADQRRTEEQLKRHAETQKITLENFHRRMSNEKYKELPIVIKGDTRGTTEAVKGALERLSTAEVKISVLHNGVGDVSENDVMLASASSAVIVAFKVNISDASRSLANNEGVEIKEYEVIYHATETIQKAMVGLLDPVFEEEELGRATIRQVFKLSSGVIAGSYVTDGVIGRKNRIRIIRDGKEIHEGNIQSLKRIKEEVREVRTGYECGILLNDFKAIQEGDEIRSFKMVELTPEL